MKVLLQWTIETPSDWVELDSADWANLPSKPLPVGRERIDSLPGWISRLNIQGVDFCGYDHYAVEDLQDGACRVTVWKDDPDDIPTDVLGEFYARVWTFLPLAPDPKMGGAWNTRQSQVIYAGPKLRQFYLDNPTEHTEVRPWEEFVPPALTRHGIWMPDALMAAHDAARTKRGWREWAEGVPANQVERGRVKPQRPQGRFLKPFGTKTYFQRDDVNEGSATHVATFEKQLVTASGGTTAMSDTYAGGESRLSFLFTTPAGEPNDAAWPTGTYRCQLDVSASGADITYGLRAAGAQTGHFARINFNTLIELETKVQVEALFTGAGLKLATTGSVSWTGGATSERFECLVAGTRAASHGNQTLDLNITDADAFADGPWTAPITENPTVSILVSDDFNRPDTPAGDLGRQWTAIDGGRVLSKQLRMSGANSAQINKVLPEGQTASIRFVASSGTTRESGIAVRMSGSGASISGYAALYNNPAVSPSLRLYKYVNEAPSAGTLLAESSATLAAGDRVILTAVGSSVRVDLNGLLRMDVTDSSLTAGNAGVISRDTTAGTIDWDDFIADVALSVTDVLNDTPVSLVLTLSAQDDLGAGQVFNESPSVAWVLQGTLSDPLSAADQPTLQYLLASSAAEASVQTEPLSLTGVLAPSQTDVKSFDELILLSATLAAQGTDLAALVDNISTSEIWAATDADSDLAIDSLSALLALLPSSTDTKAGVLTEDISTAFTLATSETDVQAGSESLTVTSLLTAVDADTEMALEAQTVVAVLSPAEIDFQAIVADISVAILFTLTELDNAVDIDQPAIIGILVGTAVSVGSLVDAQSQTIVFDPTASEQMAGALVENPSAVFALASTPIDRTSLIDARSETIVIPAADTDAATGSEAQAVTALLTPASTDGRVLVADLAQTLVFAVSEADIATGLEGPAQTAVLTPLQTEIGLGVETRSESIVFVPTESDLITGVLTENISAPFALLSTEQSVFSGTDSPTLSQSLVSLIIDLGTGLDTGSVTEVLSATDTDAGLLQDNPAVSQVWLPSVADSLIRVGLSEDVSATFVLAAASVAPVVGRDVFESAFVALATETDKTQSTEPVTVGIVEVPAVAEGITIPVDLASAFAVLSTDQSFVTIEQGPLAMVAVSPTETSAAQFLDLPTQAIDSSHLSDSVQAGIDVSQALLILSMVPAEELILFSGGLSGIEVVVDGRKRVAKAARSFLSRLSGRKFTSQPPGKGSL